MAHTEHSSLPAGTGNTPGLGEAFNINLSTGQGTYSYRIPLPEGVAGHTPQLVLEYSHGSGQGPFGCGFGLAQRSIHRRLDFGTPAEGIVERFLDGSTEIVEIADGTFAAVREALYTRYTRIGSGWRVEERSGVVHELGQSAAGRVAPPEQPGRPVEWLVERTLDVSGNVIEYTYRFDRGFAYPATIRYAIYEVRFLYEARPDVRHDGRAGFSRHRGLRCAEIVLVFEPGPNERVIRSYAFDYTLAHGGGMSLLAGIRLIARGDPAAGTTDVRRPTVRFRYTEIDPRKGRTVWWKAEAGPPPGLTEEDVALVTLDDAPLPGILAHRGGRPYYWANRGDGGWAPPRPLRQAPLASSFRRDGLAFVDMDGSGTADLMVTGPRGLQGYYENAGADGFGSFVPFPRGSGAAPPLADPGLRLVDVDGDGLVDALVKHGRGFVLWRNQGRQGWSQPSLLAGDGPQLAGVDLADPDVHMADMTGDGTPDLVRVRSGAIEYWPSLGRGRYGDRVVMRNSPRLWRDIARDALVFVDLDGDGCADLVHVSSRGLRIYYNQNGAGFADAVEIEGIPPPLPGTVIAARLDGRTAGLVWNSPARGQPEYVQFTIAGDEPPHLLAEVDNGAGLVSGFTYRAAIVDYLRDRREGGSWTTNFPFPYVVVGQTRELDRVSQRETIVEFRYHEAHFDRHLRQFNGFRRAERIERGDASRSHTRIVQEFLMDQARMPGQGPEHAALDGLLIRVETYQLDGTPLEERPLRVETCKHGLGVLGTTADGRKRVSVFVTVHREEWSERGADVRVEERQYKYDEYGRVRREEHRGSGTKTGVPQPERWRIREITYARSERHLLDRQARIVTRDQNELLLAEKRFHYDGPDFVGLPLGQCDRGLVVRETEWVSPRGEFDAHYAGMSMTGLGFIADTDADGAEAVFAAPRSLRYDERGLLCGSRDALGKESRYTHDAAGLLRIGLSDPLGHETSFEYERAIGQVRRITYADGAEIRFAHDAQGRVLRSALPGETLDDATTVYTYDESEVPTRRIARFRQGGGVTSIGVTYFDGSGKEFQQRVEVEPGKFVVSGLKLANPWGDLREEYEPTFAAIAEFAHPATADRAARRVEYDALGRIIRTTNFDKGESSAEYCPFGVLLRDANDNDKSAANLARGQYDTPREEEFDVFRNLVRVTEHLGPAGTIVTSYEIGPMGELAAVHDGRGVKFRYRHDRRGDRTAITLRESGERKVWYDARRQTVRTLDPAGHDLTAQWDEVGRQILLKSGAEVLEEYRYDVPANHALGRLAEVRYTGGRQAFSYDAAGRLLRHDHVHVRDGVEAVHSLRYEYDTLGRETVVAHDDGTRIERRLTHNGWLRAVTGFVDRIDHDPRGLPAEIDYRNGVRTRLEYTPGPGRVRRQTTTSPQDVVYQDITYTFDAMGVALSREDAAPGGFGTQTLTYDPLYQLTAVSETKGGPPVVRRYDYAPDYNLRRFDEARATLHYDDAVHPDRLSGMSVDGAPDFSASYDGNGNLLALPGRAFEYNAKNELVRVQRTDGRTATYHHDHNGLRVSKAVEQAGVVKRTLYLGDQAEVRDGVATYFVALGSLRVAVRSGGVTRFLHDDGVGTTRVVTDMAGQVVGSVESHPFGNPAASSGQVEHRTFSQHPVDDESGLVYMRRRYYAPELGRFLTPDLMAIYRPEKFLHAPQGLHLYAYVANDPMNKTDPTGMSFLKVLGAVVGVAVAFAASAFFGIVGGLLGCIAVTGVAYVLANDADPGSDTEKFLRGFMIGMNAGMNTILASACFGPVIGVAVGVINFLAVFHGIAEDPVYHGILGWSSWLMPMSWGATGIGLIFFLENRVDGWVSGSDRAKIDSISIDSRTGSIVMVGGRIHNKDGGFNMGNFVYIHRQHGNDERLRRHEIGHTLSLAAFGTVFHFAGAIGEKVYNHKEYEYSEKITESYAKRPGEPMIPMWG